MTPTCLRRSSFKKTSAGRRSGFYLQTSTDYLLWYAKDRGPVKFVSATIAKDALAEDDSTYTCVARSDGTVVPVRMRS